jgi:putative transposase
MPDDRRNRVPGGSYFLTVNLRDRNSRLLGDRIDALRDAVRTVRAGATFHVDAWVVLADHMHCVWTLLADDDDCSGRWRLAKTLFATAMPTAERRSATLVRNGERGIRQRRFRDPTIRDDRDHAAHMDYVHFDPVKHGLVEHVADWPSELGERR